MSEPMGNARRTFALGIALLLVGSLCQPAQAGERTNEREIAQLRTFLAGAPTVSSAPALIPLVR